jgi:regulation of enolase protein 1 (concanavalin A-like superfamily)
MDPSDTFEEARRQSEWLKVGREKIRHQEDCGQLVRRDQIDAALASVGAELQAIIRRLPNKADDIAIAVSKEGVHGVRVFLRQLAFDIGNQMADKLAEIAVSAPEHDALIEDEER